MSRQSPSDGFLRNLSATVSDRLRLEWGSPGGERSGLDMKHVRLRRQMKL